jgi:hypothetical protein
MRGFARRSGLRILARRGNRRKLRLLELREFCLAGLLLPGLRGGSVKSELRAARIRCGAAHGVGFPDAAVTTGTGAKSMARAGAVTLGRSVAVPAIVAPGGTGTVALAAAGVEALAAAASRAGTLAHTGPVARPSAAARTRAVAPAGAAGA